MTPTALPLNLKEKRIVKFQLRIGSKEFLVPAEKIADLMAAIEDCEIMDELHVGTDKGSQGYGNAYVPVVHKPVLKNVLLCMPVDENLIDTIKLTMKLNDIKPRG